MSITSSIQEISPALARKWLKENSRNRKIREHRVAELAEAIRRGEWQFDGNPIRFDKHGMLLDGQHRLLAIEASGRTVTSLVVKGIDTSAQLVMDTGLKRQFADHLQINGEKNPLQLAAACNVLWRWESGHFQERLNFRIRPTFEQLDDVLRRHPSLRQCTAACRATATGKRRIPMAHGHLIAARHILIGIDQVDADAFFAAVATGTELSELDARYKFRELLHQNQKSRQKYSADHLLAFLFKSWNLFRRGEPCKQLSYRAGGVSPESFPEPK
jgi:hypothetical protein